MTNFYPASHTLALPLARGLLRCQPALVVLGVGGDPGGGPVGVEHGGAYPRVYDGDVHCGEPGRDEDPPGRHRDGLRRGPRGGVRVRVEEREVGVEGQQVVPELRG